MSQQRLWAKSRPRDEGDGWPPSMFLPQHLRDVLTAARQLVAATGDAQLSALGLAPSEWYERFGRIVTLAAIFHDLGKANDHFQRMVKGDRDLRQGLRHEWVTLLILAGPEFRKWLQPAFIVPEEDLLVLLWAVSGHHPAYNRPSPPRTAVEGAGAMLVLHGGHPDFAECLAIAAEEFGLGVAPPTAEETWPLVKAGNVFQQIFRYVQEVDRSWRDWQEADSPFVGLVAAAKDCLVAADVAGSALPRRFADADQRSGWIPACFARTPTPDQMAQLICKRLADQDTGRAPAPAELDDLLRGFQREVADAPNVLPGDVVFIKAGCGSGKTLAAYNWARVRHPGKRLYLCYPTTGTATEGFRDYLVGEHEAKFGAELFHGRAAVDKLLLVRGDTERERRDDEADALARIESLDAWSTPIVCCTVDTVLGLVQNNRRGLYAWPALAGAAFVFDEIHAYDDRLFGALLRFLQALPGAPALLMTASLPAVRRKCLEECLSRQGRSLVAIPGPAELEKRPRYHRLKEAAEDPAEAVRHHAAALRDKAKILWVCNTVDRAIAAADEVSDLGPLIYHSRFRYEDRVQRHGSVIDAFKSKEQAAVAVCTQVAEMSLDLSATLLITELAPVPALIQRLGRLNRRAKKGDSTCPFLVYGPPGELPYSPDELASARAWLADLGAGKLSQADLSQGWEAHDAIRRPDYVASAWLDGGPATTVLELREATPGITVVLERDRTAIARGEMELMNTTLPMPPPPRGLNWREWPTIKGVPVAPEGNIDYHKLRGAKWVRPED